MLQGDQQAFAWRWECNK